MEFVPGLYHVKELSSGLLSALCTFQSGFSHAFGEAYPCAWDASKSSLYSYPSISALRKGMGNHYAEGESSNAQSNGALERRYPSASELGLTRQGSRIASDRNKKYK
jgi:hypothetical protein